MKPSTLEKKRRKIKVGGANKYTFTVVIERDEDGYYAECPALQGCFTQGDTYEETLDNIKDAIRLHIEDRLACGEPIPDYDEVSVTTVEVTCHAETSASHRQRSHSSLGKDRVRVGSAKQ